MPPTTAKRLRPAKRVLTPLTFVVHILKFVWHINVWFRVRRRVLARAPLSSVSTAVGQPKTGPVVTPALAELVMLAVSRVNGCHICKDFHSREALAAGASPEEIRKLLTEHGSFAVLDENADNNRHSIFSSSSSSNSSANIGHTNGNAISIDGHEAVALAFSEAFAHSNGACTAGELAVLTREFGIAGAEDVLVHVRMVFLGNLIGNTWESLVARFGVGRDRGAFAAAHSSSGNEVVVTFLLIPFAAMFVLLSVAVKFSLWLVPPAQ